MQGNDTGDSSGDLVYSDFSLSFRSQFEWWRLHGICRLVGHSEDCPLHCHKQLLVSPNPRCSLWVCEILATFCVVYVWCGLSHSSVQQNARRLCTTLITHQLTDHSQLKHLFAYLWWVLYCHPTCVTVSKHMEGQVITIRYLKCL
jgi:hypothetical protein